MDCTWCAPACLPNSMPTVACAPTNASVRWSGPSAATVDLKVRPVFHRSAERVRAVLLCMLAYYVEWHMRQQLRPMLFDDEDREGAEAVRTSIVAPAQVSEAAQAKARSKRTADGAPVHSLRTLLNDLATVTRNTVAPRLPGTEPFEVITRPTRLQDKALKLLGVRCRVPSNAPPYFLIGPENQ